MNGFYGTFYKLYTFDAHKKGEPLKEFIIVYKITNRLNGNYHIGKITTLLVDINSILYRAVPKRITLGVMKSDLKFEILFSTFDNAEALSMKRKFLTQYK